MEAIKIWFDPEKGYYRAFMPSGDELPLMGRLTIDDGFDPSIQKRAAFPSATINLVVDIVNEIPKKS